VTNTSKVEFWVELEPETWTTYLGEERLSKVKAVRLTQSKKPLIRKANNRVVKLVLEVPTDDFIQNVPTINITVKSKALSGYTGTTEEVANKAFDAL
jgi:hypothetical protein